MVLSLLSNFIAEIQYISMEVMLFGQLAEIAGTNSLQVNGVRDTAQLIRELHQLHPALASIPYLVAVNKEVVHGIASLEEEAIVALLPPYAGG